MADKQLPEHMQNRIRAAWLAGGTTLQIAKVLNVGKKSVTRYRPRSCKVREGKKRAQNALGLNQSNPQTS